MSLKIELKSLQGLGPKSAMMLQEVGILEVADFMASDPYLLYAKLKKQFPNTSLNMLYAILGAQENTHWQKIKNERRLEILLRLEEMGLLSRK